MIRRIYWAIKIALFDADKISFRKNCVYIQEKLYLAGSSKFGVRKISLEGK